MAFLGTYEFKFPAKFQTKLNIGYFITQKLHPLCSLLFDIFFSCPLKWAHVICIRFNQLSVLHEL